MTWAYVGLVAVAALLAAVLLFVATRPRDRIISGTSAILVLAALGVGAWTFFTVGSDVRVPIAEDPDGAVCLVDPIGDNPERTVPWDSDCGEALKRQLVISIGPTVAMAGLTLVVTAIDFSRRRRHSATRQQTTSAV